MVARTGRVSRQAVRPGLFVLAILLLSYSTSVSPGIVGRTSDMVASAAIGMSAAVLPNSENMVAAQLAEKERELNTREAALTEKQGRFLGDERFALVSFLSSLVLFALLALNFVMDWRRDRLREHSGARVIVP